MTMIPEGSCDTEDWRNDPENSAFYQAGINYILLYIQIIKKTIILNQNYISKYYSFYCMLTVYVQLKILISL